jgi:hypothetical protein
MAGPFLQADAVASVSWPMQDAATQEATAAPPPVTVAPPSPPRARIVRDELGDRMLQLREPCEDGDRRACVRLGIINGENREPCGVNIPMSSFMNETSDQPRRCELMPD